MIYNNSRTPLRCSGIALEEAMKAYYNSKLADKIHRGVEGAKYLDHKVLVQILEETEPEIFK